VANLPRPRKRNRTKWRYRPRSRISAQAISERLGHASAAFTLHTYGHVVPGMDNDAAVTVTGLIPRAVNDRYC
jgi:integrase